MQSEGKLKSWDDERAFGFIEPRHGGQDIFVHITAFKGKSVKPKIGQSLTFEVELNAEGKKRAKNVQSVLTSRLRKTKNSPAQWGGVSYFAIPVFVVVFVVVSMIWRTPLWIAGLYLIASIISFAAYAVDKTAAVAGRWRVSEGALILLGIIGGWPGAIVAQQILRHKSNKAEFLAAFWGSVFVNVVAFVALSIYTHSSRTLN